MAMHSRFLTGYDPFPSAYLLVDMFFLMSGFVIAHAYERKLADGGYFGTFVLRRYARLMPMWLIGLGIGSSITLLGAWQHGQLPANIATFVAAWFFIPLPGSVYLFPGNSPGWSLFFEMVANLFYGALVLRLTRTALLVMLAVAAIAVAVAGFQHDSLEGGSLWSTWHIGLLRVSFSFFLGVLMFRVMSGRRSRSLPRWLFPLAMAGLILLAHLNPAAGLRPVFDVVTILIVLPATMLLTLNIRSSPSALAERLGLLSYPLYAIHLGVFMVAHFAQGALTGRWYAHMPFAPAAVVVAGTVAAAYILGRWIDPAAQRFAGRMILRRPVRTSASALNPLG